MGEKQIVYDRTPDMKIKLSDGRVVTLGELEPIFPKVNRRSLQRDLKLLLEKSLIRGTGSAALTDPNRSYVPAPDRAPRGGRRRKL